LPDINALQNALENVIQKSSSILEYFYNFYKYWQNSFFLGSVSGKVYFFKSRQIIDGEQQRGK